ncbi:MAG: hypothetical protein JWO05_2899 [Gemmatimonadetes bacterium]|nr:hypothetical protein [Gemmatimonadota bacterium]
MRLAILSDIHGNLLALEAVLADLAARAPDAVVNLGDCATSPLWPRETVELLDTLGWPTVRGNHDRWLVEAPPRDSLPRSVSFTRASLTHEQRARYASLPASLELAPGTLALHGRPSSDSEYLLEEKVDGRLANSTLRTLDQRLAGVAHDVVLCGHSHQQHFAYATGGRLVLNPGSVGCPRSADDEPLDTVEAGSPHARYAVITQRGARWSVEMIALDYAFSEVAGQATRNGRADWATGFLHGAG